MGEKDFLKEGMKKFTEDFKKFGKIEKDGSLWIDSGTTNQQIGKIKRPEKKENGRENYEEDKAKFKLFLGDVYEKILEVLRNYIDLREEYYIITANWIIGTYLHSSFSTYPYLFLNAMRGSGKSRMLNLIASLSYHGTIIGSPTEAVLFRTPAGDTLCLDEYEGIMRKGNEGLRELLNASYKKGMKIFRMKQKKIEGSTEHVREEFEPYRPICLANIWGMEEVLGDRCITIILEKSDREDIMRIIEDFPQNPTINWIKQGLEANLVQLCSFFDVVRGIKRWNLYIKSQYTTLYSLTTLKTQSTQSTQDFSDEELEIFNKIKDTGINGRNLELFFPLLLIGKFISDEAFESILEIASELTKEKRQEEMTESKDVAVYDFVSKLEVTLNYKSVRTLTNAFRNFIGEMDDKKDLWLNEKWFGRSLKRLNLILDKRRMSGGIEVTLDIAKAKKKMEKFK